MPMKNSHLSNECLVALVKKSQEFRNENLKIKIMVLLILTGTAAVLVQDICIPNDNTFV